MKRLRPPGPEFAELVVRHALRIPPGRVTTYGHLARAAGGGPMSAQSVTRVLGKAYEAGETRIPFHRIVYADGRVWIDDRHRTERLALYRKEGIELDAKHKIVNFKQLLFPL